MANGRPTQQRRGGNGEKGKGKGKGPGKGKPGAPAWSVVIAEGPESAAIFLSDGALEPSNTLLTSRPDGSIAIFYWQ